MFGGDRFQNETILVGKSNLFFDSHQKRWGGTDFVGGGTISNWWEKAIFFETILVGMVLFGGKKRSVKKALGGERFQILVGIEYYA